MSLNISLPKRKKAISLTPLIDVVFILLLFFMLTSSFVPWRTLDTPLTVTSDNVEKNDPSDSVILTLKLNDGLVWINGKEISVADQAYFETLITDHYDATFLIKAEGDVTLQTLMQLADRMKLNGAEKVSIANAFALPEAQ